MNAKMIGVLLLACSLQAATGLVFDVGPARCAAGTEYWCQNLDSARSCGAVRHCIQNVWERRVLPKDKSEICDLCKQMVQEARDQLQSNETQEEIKEVFEGTCRIYFPIKKISDECIKIVDDYIPDLVEELSSMMDPQMVCATAGLCNSYSFLNKLGVAKIVSTPSVCEECIDVAEKVIEKIGNETDADFKDQLKKLCDMAPGAVHETCKMAVDLYYKELKADVGKLQPRELCQLGGVCDGIGSPPRFNLIMTNGMILSAPKPKTPECDFCKQLVQHLKDLITANSTEQEVRDTLMNLCGQLGGFADECKNMVSEYFYEIYDFLENQLDPAAVCQAIGICGSELASVPLTRIRPAKRITGRDEQNSIDWELTRHPQQLTDTRLMPQILVPHTLIPKHTSVSCAFCEYAIRELVAVIGDNKTEEAIKQALDGLCQRLPQTLVQECTDYVNDYSDLIISLLQQEIDPDTVCIALKLCQQPPADNRWTHTLHTKTMPSLKVKFPKTKHVANKKLMGSGVGDFNKCEVCNLLISYVDSMLEDQPTEDEIVHALDNGCGLLPKSVYAQCRSIVDTYGEYILQYIGSVSAKQVCQAIDVCPRTPGHVHLLGGNKCTYGPSYWCQSIHHARACKAEEHCRNKVWN